MIRLAEVLYPLPDALQASLEQSRDTSTTSLSINGKLKRRKSLIGDRITTTQEGKSNWNVNILNSSLFSHLSFFLIVNSATSEHNFN
jgi:hypothetical protein